MRTSKPTVSFVYVITSELLAQDGNEMKIPSGTTVFGQMYVPAGSMQKALAVSSREWSEQCYDFTDVLVSKRFNMGNWDFDDYPDGSSERRLCVEAAKTGKVQYGVLVKGKA